jgi:hypothetical protein
MAKAQMFIITMVFLAGLIVAVQQILIQYSELDISKGFDRSDSHLIDNIKDMFNRTLESSECCPVALGRVKEMDGFINRRGGGSYFLELGYNGNQAVNIRCENFNTNDSVLNLSVKVTTAGTETEGTFSFLAKDGFPPSIRDAGVYPNPGGKNLEGTVFNITALITDCSGVEGVNVTIQDSDENDIDVQVMADDGTKGDAVAGDDVYTLLWNSTGFCVNPFGCSYYMDIEACDVFGNCGEVENI